MARQFIEKGSVYVGDGNRRVRVGAVFYQDGDPKCKMVKIYHLGPEGGYENISIDDFDAEFDPE